MNDVTLHQPVTTHVNPINAPDITHTDKPEQEASADIIRIDATKLTTLLNVVGESVHAASHANILLKKLLGFNLDGAVATVVTSLADTLERISRYSTDLQRATLTTRMKPVGVLFQKIQTHIHAQAKARGQQINLVITGAHTEIDLDILDSLHQPLILIAGNILARPPTKEARAVTIELTARQGASSVMIEIKDDGREIDRAALFVQAAQAGLINADDVLSDEAVLQLVFAAGVTEESRQALLPVKTSVARHRGVAHLTSTPDNTRFLLRFPIDLSIIPTMVVRTAETAFALPMVAVERIITLPAYLDSVNNNPVFKDQGRPLPVLSLAAVLGYPAREERLGVIIAAPTPYVLTMEDIEGATELIITPFTAIKTSGITGTARSAMGEVVLVLGVVFLLDGCRSSTRSTTMR